MMLRGHDFVSMDDLSPEEVLQVLDTATDLKRRAKTGDRPALLAGRVLAMIFEKPSLRTRVTFEVGMWGLAATPGTRRPRMVRREDGETGPDVRKILDGWG